MSPGETQMRINVSGGSPTSIKNTAGSEENATMSCTKARRTHASERGHGDAPGAVAGGKEVGEQLREARIAPNGWLHGRRLGAERGRRLGRRGGGAGDDDGGAGMGVVSGTIAVSVPAVGEDESVSEMDAAMGSPNA